MAAVKKGGNGILMRIRHRECCIKFKLDASAFYVYGYYDYVNVIVFMYSFL